MTGEWGAIAISLGLLLIISVFMTQLGLALDVTAEPTEEITYIQETVLEGFTILGITVNIVPVFARQFIINVLIGFSLIPIVIRIPLIIFIGALFTYGVIKLLPTT